MKHKIFKTFIIVLFAISLTGCKARDLDGNVKTEFGIKETAVYKNIYYTVTDVEYTDTLSQGVQTSDENKTYIALTFQVENKSKKEIDVPSCIIITEKTSSEQETVSWEGDINKHTIDGG